MDALTRERFAPGRQTVVTDEILARRLVLLGVDDTAVVAEQAQTRRLRADALVRSRRLARSLRMYEVRSRQGAPAREASGQASPHGPARYATVPA